MSSIIIISFLRALKTQMSLLLWINNQRLFFICRLFERLQQNDGIDGLYRSESCKKCAVSRRAVKNYTKSWCQKIEKRTDVFLLWKKRKKEKKRRTNLRDSITVLSSQIISSSLTLIYFIQYDRIFYILFFLLKFVNFKYVVRVFDFQETLGTVKKLFLPEYQIFTKGYHVFVACCK